MTEQLINNVVTTLAANVGIGATTMVVASATGLPTSGNYRAVIAGEIILVTSRSGTTLTIQKGQEGTADVAHTSGDSVAFDLTAAGLIAAIGDQVTTHTTPNAHHNQSHTNADHSAAGTPSTQAYSDAPVVGTSTSDSKSDHKHGMPAAGSGSVPPQGANYIISKVGSNYQAYNTATGVVDYTSTTQVGAIINNASDALVAAGTAGGLILLKSGQVYPVKTKISLGAGVELRGDGAMVEGVSTGAVLNCTAASTIVAVVELTGNYAIASGLIVDANSLATVGIKMIGDGQVVQDCSVKNAVDFCLHMTGANRCVVKGTRMDNATANGGVGMKIEGADHIIDNFRIAGAAANGWALYVSGQHAMISNGHVTASDTSKGVCKVDNNGNSFTNIMFDTGPDGTNGNEAIRIESGGNAFVGCVIFNNKGANTAAFSIRKVSAGDWRIGNIIDGCLIGDFVAGGSGTPQAFKYALTFFDESGAVPTNLARWGGTVLSNCRLVDIVTDILNVVPVDCTNPHAIHIVNTARHQQDTTTPLLFGSENYGKAVFSGNGTITAFTIPHGIGSKPTCAEIVGGSADAAGAKWVSTLNATNLIVTFTTAPASGTNNVTIYWKVWM